MTGFGGIPGLEYESARPELRKQSGPGMASFWLAVLAVVLIVGGFGIAFVLAFAVRRAGGGGAASTVPVMLIGLLICGGLLASLVGVGLGIWSLLQRNRKRVFGVLGLVINGLILLGVAGLMILGLAMKHVRT